MIQVESLEIDVLVHQTVTITHVLAFLLPLSWLLVAFEALQSSHKGTTTEAEADKRQTHR